MSKKKLQLTVLMLLRATYRMVSRVIVGFSLLISASAFAEDGDYAPDTLWIWSGSVGIVSWSSLADLESVTGGNFDSVGYAVEFSGYRHVTQWGSADVFLGADFGVFGTSGDVQGITEDFTQRGLYFTPSVKFRFGASDSRYLSLEAGMGVYKVDLAELDCETPQTLCTEIQDPFDSTAAGGYVGVSAGLGHRVIAGLRAHYADFGEVTGINSVTGELKGPFYILSIGMTFGR